MLHIIVMVEDSVNVNPVSSNHKKWDIFKEVY